MSLPSVHEADSISIPPNGNGLALQSQRSGMMSAFTRHKLLVFFMLFCGLGFGYLYYLRTPVLYQSSTSIILIQQQGPMAHMSSGLSYEHQLSTQMHVARSPEIIKRAVYPERYFLPSDKDEDEATDAGRSNEDSGEADSQAEGQATAADPVEEEDTRELRALETFVGEPDIVRAIVEGTATAAINDDIFALTFTGPNPLECKRVLEVVTEAYRDYMEEQYASTGDQLLELLQDALVNLKKELDTRQAAYRAFVADPVNAGLIAQGEEAPINLHSQNLENIIRQRRAVEDRIRDINTTISAITQFQMEGGSLEAFQLLMKEMPLGEFATQDVAIENRKEDLRTQIEQLEFEDQQLGARLGIDHPDRQQMRGQMALLRQRLQRLEDYETAPPEDRVAIWLEALQSQLDLATLQREQLKTEFNSERIFATEDRVKELEAADLQAGIASAEQLYNSVLRQIDEINLIDDLDRVRIDIIARPESGEQVQPVFSTIMTTAGALGILVGLVFGYLLERADASFRSPDEIRGELSIPVIGHIPTFPDRLRLKNQDTKLDKSLWSFHRPGGSIAEAFKGIRTSLQFNRHEEVHQVLMVTSPSPGEGKSTVSANLAVSLAHLGKKVLLMDADLRRATQPRLFGMLEEPGLTNVLVDDVEPFDVIQPTEVEGLSLLAGGRQVRNPSELLSSPKMADLIKVLREQYDYVLIDTPPVLVVTDPLTVAPLADAVIGVLKLSRRTRREATATIERIIDVGGEMLGVVVNGLESGMGYGTGYGHGGYQYTYGYGYGYGRYYNQHEENGPHPDDQRRRITVT